MRNLTHSIPENRYKSEVSDNWVDARFEAFMNNSPAVAWIKDSLGRYTYANSEFCLKFSLNIDDVIGKTDNDLLDHEVVNLINEDDNFVMASGEKKEIYENVPGPDGLMRNWWVHKFPIINDTGEVFTAGIGFDVTDKTKAEEALAESEKRYRLISENTRDLICLHKPDGSYTYVSPSVFDISGYRPEELMDKSPFYFFDPQDLDKLKSAFSNITLNSSRTNVFRFVKKDGKTISMEMTFQPIFTETGELVQIQTVCRDISHRIATEKEISRYLENLEGMNKELIEAKEIAEKSVRIKEEFLANTSHEIRTPMNAIIGLTRLLLDTSLNNQQKEYLEAISKSGETLLVVLNDILDLSKIEAGKMTFEEISFSPCESIRFTMDLLRPKAAEKGIKFEYKADDNVPFSVVGDPIRLNQILINILSNAIKFTHHGGIILKLEMLKSDTEEIRLLFSVKDTGIGIPIEKQESIFTSFTQGNLSTARKYGGTGLGLAIVKRLVELQGGSVSVSSEVNVGSTFKVLIKYKKDEIGLQMTLNLNHDRYEDHLLGKRGLLVEDNAINQLVSSKVLKDFGLTVDIANNGIEAIKMMNENRYEIVFMDLVMPEMDGFETTRYIRNNMPDNINSLPIIAMTAHPINGELDKCFECGMNDYISKPFDAKNLFNKIVNLISKKAEMNGSDHQPEDMERNVNLGYLRNLSEGSDSFIREILEMIIAEIPKSAAELHESLLKNDWDRVKFLAHKMKPSFGLVGVKSAEALMQRIEKNASDMPDPALLKDMIDNAMIIVKTCTAELEQELIKLDPK